jgi:hypothetical protein
VALARALPPPPGLPQGDSVGALAGSAAGSIVGAVPRTAAGYMAGPVAGAMAGAITGAMLGAILGATLGAVFGAMPGAVQKKDCMHSKRLADPSITLTEIEPVDLARQADSRWPSRQHRESTWVLPKNCCIICGVWPHTLLIFPGAVEGQNCRR